MTLSRRAVLAGAAGLGLAAGQAAASGTDPLRIGRLIARNYLKRSDIMLYDTGSVRGVHYAEAATAYGALKFAGMTSDKDLIAGVAARYRRVLDEKIVNTANHVDVNAFGIWPLELYRQTGDFDALQQGLSLADGQWVNVGADGLTSQTRFWIDDIWMIGMLQVEAFRATRKPVHLDRAAREVDAYVRRLQLANGLFYHGDQAPFSWGRGNGWVAVGLAEVLSDLPADDSRAASLRDGYRRMMDALLTYQGQDGLWRQIVDRPDSWAESSCSAMFAYAMALGVKRGLLSGEAYDKARRRAWRALCRRLQPDGQLAGICVGTAQSADVQYYLDRPVVTGDLHGQAPMLWLAGVMAEA